MKNLNVIAIGAAVLFVVAMYLPWITVEGGGMSMSANLWEMKEKRTDPNFGMIMLVMVVLAAGLCQVPKKIGPIIGIVIGGLALGLNLMILFGKIAKTTAAIKAMGGTGGAGIGAYLAVLCCLGVVVACVMQMGKLKKAA